MTLPIKPIIDRTDADATYAKQHPGNLTYNKGALNLEIDLNRIETNCKYLADQLNSYGYHTALAFKMDWVMTDYPYKRDLDRIRGNIRAILAAYSTMQGSPAMVWADCFGWNDANSIEQNLQNINILLERMIKGFRVSGGFNFYSGSEVVLP